MSGRKLDASYRSLDMQLGSHDHARIAASRSTASPELLASLGLYDLIGTATKDRRKAVLERFEQTGRQIRRQGFIDLVSSFEFDLFRLLGVATSKSRHTLKRYYEAGHPFSGSPEEMARTTADFSNLGGYKRLLAETTSGVIDPRRELWSVISHRDWLAHGERWTSSAIPPTIEAAYRILSLELDTVEGKQRH